MGVKSVKTCTMGKFSAIQYLSVLLLPLVLQLFLHHILTLNFAQVKSMDDNCGEWVECMGVASGCGEQEVGVASGSGWNLWVWLLGVVLMRYIDFLILLIPTPLVSVLFCSSIPTFLFIFKNVFRSCSSTFFNYILGSY